MHSASTLPQTPRLESQVSPLAQLAAAAQTACEHDSRAAWASPTQRNEPSLEQASLTLPALPPVLKAAPPLAAPPALAPPMAAPPTAAIFASPPLPLVVTPPLALAAPPLVPPLASVPPAA